MLYVSHPLAEKIKDFLLLSFPQKTNPPLSPSLKLWKELKSLGTQLWLDTGDLEAAEASWSQEITGLTTNNTLLNTEIQKGIYDDLIRTANELLTELPIKERVIEVAFILNAWHGLRLVDKFQVPVSVELHTDLAHDYEATVEYGKRFYAICPSHFIIKVPLTPAGLLATRQLRSLNIPVNLTLSFSARQNALATLLASPSYVNIFLGRINAFIQDNQLGSGEMAGEKVTLASQRAVTRLSPNPALPTHQIAASLRNASQIFDLAGLDVFTMPLKVAEEALGIKDKSIDNQREKNYDVALNQKEVEPLYQTLWEITSQEEEAFHRISENPPSDVNELKKRLSQFGFSALFPDFLEEEQTTIREEGKIPRFTTWKNQLQSGKISLDALLTQAGLQSFIADQSQLDKRISRLINE